MVHAAMISTLGSSYEAFVRGRSLLEEVPRKAIGYTGAMFMFTVLQESLRAVRGKHDAINSGVAGALAGALVAGYYQGPQYRLLSASMWGPICLASHLMNDVVKPRPLIEDWLISEGLLDPIVRERRAKATLIANKSNEMMPMGNLIEMATAVRDRELQSLYDASRGKTSQDVSSSRNQAVRKVKEEEEEVDHEYEAWLIEAIRAGVAISLEPSEEEQKEATKAKQRSWIEWLKGMQKT
jgi:hypothetical protein